MRCREIVKLERGAARGRRVRVILMNGAGHIDGKQLCSFVSIRNRAGVHTPGGWINIPVRAIKRVIIGKKVK